MNVHPLAVGFGGPFLGVGSRSHDAWPVLLKAEKSPLHKSPSLPAPLDVVDK